MRYKFSEPRDGLIRVKGPGINVLLGSENKLEICNLLDDAFDAGARHAKDTLVCSHAWSRVDRQGYSKRGAKAPDYPYYKDLVYGTILCSGCGETREILVCDKRYKEVK